MRRPSFLMRAIRVSSSLFNCFFLNHVPRAAPSFRQLSLYAHPDPHPARPGLRAVSGARSALVSDVENCSSLERGSQPFATPTRPMWDRTHYFVLTYNMCVRVCIQKICKYTCAHKKATLQLIRKPLQTCPGVSTRPSAVKQAFTTCLKSFTHITGSRTGAGRQAGTFCPGHSPCIPKHYKGRERVASYCQHVCRKSSKLHQISAPFFNICSSLRSMNLSPVTCGRIHDNVYHMHKRLGHIHACRSAQS